MYRIMLLTACVTFFPLAVADNIVDETCATVPADSIKAPASPSIEVAFSPDGGGESLVLKTISAAKSSIRLAAYSFTLPSVVRALTHAKQRGVDVAVLIDYKINLEGARNNAPKQALKLLVSAGIPTRTISTYFAHHDKYMVVDGCHTETGSFNYTTAAAKYNSENVMVIWNNPQVANQYIAHWQSRWQQSQDYHPSY